MRSSGLLILISLAKNVELKHFSKPDCLQKIECKAVFKGELRELAWPTAHGIKEYLRARKIKFLKPGKTEIELELEGKEQYAILGLSVDRLPPLKKGDTVLVKGYRLECSKNRYVIITQLN